MFSKLKRFSSCFICLIFYIFLFANNFGNINQTCKAADTGTTFIPLVNIKDSFNGHAIWWPNDDWDTYFDNGAIPENWNQSIDEYKNLSHGLDGYSAFYTSDPDRNNGVGGLPTDGKVTIGGVPFILQQNENKKDCIRLNSTTPSINPISLSYLFANNTNTTNKSLKFKNIYVMGVVAGPNAGNAFKINGSYNYYNGSTYEEHNYGGDDVIGSLYDYFANTDNDTIGGNSYTRDYYVRKCNANYWINNNQSDIQYRPNNTELSNPNIQCCKIDTKSAQLQTLGVSYSDASNGEQFCCIFAITAEVETDLVASDITYRGFELDFLDNDQYTIRSKRLEASVEPIFNNCAFYSNDDNNGIGYTSYLFKHCKQNTTYYCRVTKMDDTYSYLTVKTLPGRRLKLTAYTTPKKYNGTQQRLIDSVEIMDAGTSDNPENINISTYSDYETFKENIYLRIKNSNYDTGWHNLNYLNSLTAMNAGTYYVYYFIDDDVEPLRFYIPTALSAEITISN